MKATVTIDIPASAEKFVSALAYFTGLTVDEAAQRTADALFPPLFRNEPIGSFSVESLLGIFPEIRAKLVSVLGIDANDDRSTLDLMQGIGALAVLTPLMAAMDDDRAPGGDLYEGETPAPESRGSETLQ